MAFANQVAVITGASSGIGWALARELAGQGCRVGLIARRKEQLDRQAGEIVQAGGTAETACADVSDRAQTEAAVEHLRSRLGPVDLLVANAGVGAPTLLDPVNVGDVEKMFRVNMLGVVYSIAAVLPEMLRRGRGHLAAVSSQAAYRALPGESAYCASKAAVNAYMEGLRIQLRGRGIAVTTICPGFVQTPMTEVNKFHMPWLMTAEKAARKIARALRRRRKVYNFPWQMTVLTKASRLAPDWMVAWLMSDYNANPPMPSKGL
jgi:short-subunit dehydrogenase